MDKKIIIGIIVGVVILGGLYMVTQSNKDDKMMEQKMEAEKMAEDKMMKEDATGKDDAMMEGKEGTMMDKADDQAMMKMGGQYMPYDASKLAFAKEGKVVLFFNASWCPTCKAIDADIKASIKDIPANTLILSVDYDSSKDLKVKYGVTTQHTFVQVDANGNSLNKWVGGNTLEKVLANIK